MEQKELIETALTLAESTPCYVFDTDMLKARAERLQKEKAVNTRLCYAMKANPFLVEPMRACVDSFEVCSPGELSICREAGVEPEKIIFSGVNKRKNEIMEALEYGVSVITLESIQQYQYVRECAGQLGRKVRIMPRLTGGGQFGMEKAELEHIIKESAQEELLEVAGIHFFTGTQKKKTSKIVEEARFLAEYCDELRERLDFQAKVLEFGTGMAVPYFAGDDFNGEMEPFSELAAFLGNEGARYRWTLEFGRYLTASCGYYMTSVVDLKRNHDVGYCLVDGGIHHVNYYGQNMAMRLPVITHVKRTGGDIAERNPTVVYATSAGTGKEVGGPAKEREWCICGSLCTFADVLARKARLENPEEGDILVFHNTGAYAVTEAVFLLLSRRMPSVWFYGKETGLTLIRGPVETALLNQPGLMERNGILS